ncbi:hypothetical protein SLNWT_7257 [Streptomyces albus]|uniref:Uncharacterized protein n=1 Tax=Streptomyces albus (strain ATCC 21838 / DSM 41398 / FERM P-419 / JCM 4703 / NBRC 107858) TaxID=1081613 RepID=A0A0B5EXV3_STRA4|nr:hypothetical protein SLNWT_7257 [Streptomyces albus]AOU81933.1 hypothetical protein SLNHY_7242 [Streptomyces albus]AYN37618.1 hypothetical protein DUI70_7125 [Streptomyces albus]
MGAPPGGRGLVLTASPQLRGMAEGDSVGRDDRGRNGRDGVSYP